MLLTLAHLSIFAQSDLERGQIIAEKGSNVLLESDKGLVELGETTALKVKLIVRPKRSDETSMQPPIERVLSVGNPYYRFANWKIVEGGGTLIGIDDSVQNYTAPTKMPVGKKAVVSVELQPIVPGLPKVILFETIQFADTENLMVLNIPGIGLKNARFELKAADALKVPSVAGVDPRVLKNLPPETLAKLAAAKKKIEQEQIDMNLEAASSNARSYFDSVQGLSVYTLIGFSQLGSTGTAGKTVPIGEDLSFSFKDWDLGRHSLDADGQTGINLFLRTMNNGAGCGELHSEKFKATCNGEVVVTKLTPDHSIGTMYSTIYSANAAGEIVRGRIFVKFKVRRSTN